VALTYAELNAHANRLAHRLIEMGVGPERAVAIALPRSIELVTALVAVLKAGAAYLPIDPEYPIERIAFMLEDSAPSCVVSTSVALRELGEVSPGVSRVDLDEPSFIRSWESGTDTDPTDEHRTAPLTPHNPAYIIYTSGSTGKPKGVVMPAAGLINLLVWQNATGSEDGEGAVAQFTSPSFDVSLQEVLSAVLSGKALAVPDDEVRHDPNRFASWINERSVTDLFVPNLIAQGLAEAVIEHGMTMASLRSIAQAGEELKLTAPLGEFVRRTGLILHNHYGPAETHVATSYTLPRNVDEWPVSAAIGRPLDNVRVYVLDDALRLVPPGVTGELYVAG
ncbi:AMP-binding protein, partial [Nocardia rhamnosiphila]|uniref:AMP-binding protein n=1 Tax=Nocardia rhamnosiphila TaxID=426716 RepID=UPI003400942E